MSKVDQYIQKNTWTEGLSFLRHILISTELEETVKWGTPNYTLDGKIVVGIAGFKGYFGLWFHNGAFLKDEAGVLHNAQEGKTRGLRQWRFQDADEVDAALVQRYVEEAIANQKAGKEIKPKPKKVSMPEELQEALASDAAFRSAYDSLTPGRQKEYCEYIDQAKQQKTRDSRLKKSMGMIREGRGLNDRYKG